MPTATRTARETLAAFHDAMRAKDADALADLYAPDGVHEFPFPFPGFPERYVGREEVRAGYGATWGATPLRVRGVRATAVHQSEEPGVVVGEHVVVVEHSAGGTFSVPGLLVLHVRDGFITLARDYMDGLSVTRARGAGEG